MRVVLDDPDAALLIDGDAGRRHDVRLARDQFEDQAIVGRCRRGGESGGGDEAEHDGGKAAESVGHGGNSRWQRMVQTRTVL